MYQRYKIGVHVCIFVDAFAELRKATVSFVMFVLLSAWDISPPTGRIFMKFDISVFFATMS